jgi:hypothetical protein
VSRIFGFVAALAALLGTVPLAAALAQCPAPLAAPSLTVALREPPVAYRLAATPEMLMTQAADNATPLGQGRHVLGLTLNRYDLRIGIEVESTRVESGYCAHLRAATITLAAQPEILVDGRYTAGTCQQRAILDHENEHVAVFRGALSRAAPAIDAMLRGGALPSALRVAARADAQTAYARAIDAALEPAFAAIRSRAQQDNSRLDTPANYAEVFRRCAAW